MALVEFDILNRNGREDRQANVCLIRLFQPESGELHLSFAGDVFGYKGNKPAIAYGHLFASIKPQ